MSEPGDTSSSEHPVVLLACGRDLACPACEYNLRDTIAPKCPECGTDLTMQMFDRPWLLPRSNFVVLCYIGLTAWMAGTTLAMIFGLRVPAGALGLEALIPLLMMVLLAGELTLMVRWVQRPARLHLMSPSLRPWAWLLLAVPGIAVCIGTAVASVVVFLTLVGVLDF